MGLLACGLFCCRRHLPFISRNYFDNVGFRLELLLLSRDYNCLFSGVEKKNFGLGGIGFRTANIFGFSMGFDSYIIPLTYHDAISIAQSVKQLEHRN